MAMLSPRAHPCVSTGTCPASEDVKRPNLTPLFPLEPVQALP